MTPKSVPKDEGICGVAPLGAPLVAQTAVGQQKLVPKRRPSASKKRKINKKRHQRAPQLRKRAPKFKLFGNLARRTARGAYNENKNQISSSFKRK